MYMLANTSHHINASKAPIIDAHPCRDAHCLALLSGLDSLHRSLFLVIVSGCSPL